MQKSKLIWNTMYSSNGQRKSKASTTMIVHNEKQHMQNLLKKLKEMESHANEHVTKKQLEKQQNIKSL